MNALIQKLRAADTLARLNHLETKAHLSHSQMHKLDQYVAKLVAIGAPAVPQLVRRLANVDEENPCSSVLLVLQQIGDPAVPFLARAKHHPNHRLRHHAISLLGRIATPAAVRELQDESIDLMDKEIVDAALHEARHHPRH